MDHSYSIHSKQETVYDPSRVQGKTNAKERFVRAYVLCASHLCECVRVRACERFTSTSACSSPQEEDVAAVVDRLCSL